jgi:hypothetical protein
MSNAYEFLYPEDLYSIKESILVVLDKPWTTMAEDEKALLSKILGSIKLTLDHVTIIHQTGLSIETLKIYQPCRVISFGVKLSDTHPPYQYHLSQEVSFIQADSLGSLTDITKKNLWVALKAGFLSVAQ